MTPFVEECRRARQAQADWAQQPVWQRLRLIRRLREILVDWREMLCAAAAADVGRLPVEVLGNELLPIAAALRFLERRAQTVLRPRRVPRRDRPLWLWGCRETVYRRPWGVIGIIGTWNYPLFLNIVPLAQALTAGNAVLWKPSEQTPQCAAVVKRWLEQAGVPDGLVQTLPATREAGPLLAEADIDCLLFTGSEAVGRRLAARLGERLIPSILELSGCDPMWVMADAELELAARAAWFALTLNRGQTCIAVRRILVQRPVWEVFVERLRKMAAAATPVRLQTPAQAAQARRWVAEAVQAGAEAVPPLSHASGQEDPYCFRPTLLLRPPLECGLVRESCFAPLAAVYPFDTVADGLELVRRSPFGLAASIFTANAVAVSGAAAAMAVGYVTINDVIAPTAHPATPFGGRGASGWGVTQGAEGLLALTVPQTVSVRRGRFRPHYPPVTAATEPALHDLLEGLLRAGHASGWRERLAGLRQLLRGVWRQRRAASSPASTDPSPSRQSS